jgi:type III secretion protein F
MASLRGNRFRALMNFVSGKGDIKMSSSIDQGVGAGQAASSPTLDIDDLMTHFNSAIDAMAQDINTKLSGNAQLDSKTMLSLQVSVGKYNSMMETASTVAKSVTDLIKSLGQRSS